MVKIDILEGETELSQYMRSGVYRIGRDYASSSEAYKQPQTGVDAGISELNSPLHLKKSLQDQTKPTQTDLCKM